MPGLRLGRSSSPWPSQKAPQPRSRKMHLVVVHNVLIICPPGAGKMLLAYALPGILPRKTIAQFANLQERPTIP